MIPMDPNFGNPTMAFSQNIMAAATNYFLDDRVSLEAVGEVVSGGTKYIAQLTSVAGTPPEKINELIAVVQGANRALMLRTIMRNAVVDINHFTASAEAPAVDKAAN